jgi:hypothetical protein
MLALIMSSVLGIQFQSLLIFFRWTTDFLDSEPVRDSAWRCRTASAWTRSPMQRKGAQAPSPLTCVVSTLDDLSMRELFGQRLHRSLLFSLLWSYLLLSSQRERNAHGHGRGVPACVFFTGLLCHCYTLQQRPAREHWWIQAETIDS